MPPLTVLRLRSIITLPGALLALPAGLGAHEPGETDGHAHPAEPAAAPAAAPAELPSLPEGVQELKFSEIFEVPVGPLGLKLTDKIKALDGQRVRVLGYMVREDSGHHGEGTAHEALTPGAPEFVPGRILLAPIPQIVSLSHYGLAEDLPPQTIYVTSPDRAT